MIVTSTVLELIGFVWIYGLQSLSNDFEFVLGYKLCFLWKSLWLGTPVLFTVSKLVNKSNVNISFAQLHVTGSRVLESVCNASLGI